MIQRKNLQTYIFVSLCVCACMYLIVYCEDLLAINNHHLKTVLADFSANIQEERSALLRTPATSIIVRSTILVWMLLHIILAACVSSSTSAIFEKSGLITVLRAQVVCVRMFSRSGILCAYYISFCMCVFVFVFVLVHVCVSRC